MIVPLTLNDSGVRDITRVLRVSVNSVLKVILEEAARAPEPELPARLADSFHFEYLCKAAVAMSDHESPNPLEDGLTHFAYALRISVCFLSHSCST